MPALFLAIDNMDTLPDGGATTFEVRGRRHVDIGRDTYLDWTLPDPDRIVSGHHCEISYRDGGYWLKDVSTNGTYLNGSSKRLSEPWRLKTGDRIAIGHYLVTVRVQEDEAAAPSARAEEEAAGAAAGGDPGASLWDLGEEGLAPPEPVSAPGRSATPAAPDVLAWHVDLPQVDRPAAADTGAAWDDAGPGASPAAATPPPDAWSIDPAEDVKPESAAPSVEPAGATAWPAEVPPAAGEEAPAATPVSGSGEGREAGASPAAAPGTDGPWPVPENPLEAPGGGPGAAEDEAAPRPDAGAGDDARRAVAALGRTDGGGLGGAPARAGDREEGGDDLPRRPGEDQPFGLAERFAGGPAHTAGAWHAEPPAATSAPASTAPVRDEPPAPVPAAPPQEAHPPPPAASAPSPAGRTAASTAPGADFLDALASELGVPRALLAEQEPAALARQVGAFMRLSVEGLHALLKARASSRGYMRAGRGTMVQQVGNNPLKFMPTAEDALRVLLGPPSRSYLGLEETLGESFKDLGAHQMALYAAMQKAVRRMMEDIEPASIERRAKEEGGLGLSRKARLWEIYKERYNARAEPHDDGMVDVFLMYFSEAYEEALGRD